MRAIRGRDIVDSAVVLALLPFSWLLPQRLWPSFARQLGSTHVRLLGTKTGSLDGAVLADLGIDARELEVGFRQHNYWELLEILREHAPWGWKVDVSINGREHLDAALAAGRGAVLWFTPFTHADVVFKKGLHDAGYSVNHLSALTHGFSDTKFGVAVLNPVKTSVENRYLKERFVIGGNNVGKVIRDLLDRLRHNELVSVTAVQTGKLTGERALFEGTLRLAKGAPNFAWTTGAALIPVFVVPVAGGYRIEVEPPLDAPPPNAASPEEEFIASYVPILERYIRRFPHLWRGWLGSPRYWVPKSMNRH